jgi:hypothetical protein
MATWQGVNVNTGTAEGSKYNEIGVTVETWIANLGTTLVSTDVVKFAVIPAGVYLQNVTIDVDKLDSAVSGAITFEVGYTNSGTTVAGAYIATGNTTAQAGGIQGANVAGTVGATYTVPTTVQATITNSAGTAVAGKMRCNVAYTANP